MKKQILHFVPFKIDGDHGTPACNAFQEPGWSGLSTLLKETAGTRKQVTCKNCRRTRIFRKLK